MQLQDNTTKITNMSQLNLALLLLQVASHKMEVLSNLLPSTTKQSTTAYLYM